MHDLLNPDKKLIPVSAVPSLLAELTGVQRCRATVYQWIKKGCRTMDARIVKLKAVKKMNHLYTTKENVLEFIKSVG